LAASICRAVLCLSNIFCINFVLVSFRSSTYATLVRENR
jgi:hypothetical protein